MSDSTNLLTKLTIEFGTLFRYCLQRDIISLTSERPCQEEFWNNIEDEVEDSFLYSIEQSFHC